MTQGTTWIRRGAAAALAIGLAACGSSAEVLPDAPRPDAGVAIDATPDALPDAPPDALPDAPSDAVPVIDLDHDGHAAGADCDDGNAAVWQDLAFSFRDLDGDGRTVAMIGTVCSGASLPAGYATVASAADCDDTDAAVFTTLTGFVDGDGDGFGVGLMLTFCTGGALPAGFATMGDDCAADDATRWIERPYVFRDADGDGAAVPSIGMVCSGATLPGGYLASAPAGAPDCDDTSAAVSVPLLVFVDADGDGFGAGASQLACTNGVAPAGFSTSGADCDDASAAAWISLVYTAVDVDGDGATTPMMGTRCTAGALLPPYFATPTGNDCDDANAAVSIALTVFADGDGDGVGAGASQQACTNGSTPTGFALTGTDCADSDAAVWALLSYAGVDGDGDGATVAQPGQLCTNGSLPPPYKATLSGKDCDDDNATLTHLAVFYPDQDHDGVGAPPRQVLCVGTAVPAGVARGGYDDDDSDASVIEDEDEDELLELLVLSN